MYYFKKHYKDFFHNFILPYGSRFVDPIQFIHEDKIKLEYDKIQKERILSYSKDRTKIIKSLKMINELAKNQALLHMTYLSEEILDSIVRLDIPPTILLTQYNIIHKKTKIQHQGKSSFVLSNKEDELIEYYSKHLHFIVPQNDFLFNSNKKYPKIENYCQFKNISNDLTCTKNHHLFGNFLLKPTIIEKNKLSVL